MTARQLSRVYAGSQVRSLRLRLGMDLATFAERAGLSVSYLSQIENDNRPITVAVNAMLIKAFPYDWDGLVASDASEKMQELNQALLDPLFESREGELAHLLRAAEQHPRLVDHFLTLHRAHQRNEERRQRDDEAMHSGLVSVTRLPWEEVRDWFHDEGNYIDDLDTAAEALALELGAPLISEAALASRLKRRFRVQLASVENLNHGAPLKYYDPERRVLHLNRSLPVETRRFMVADQLVTLEYADLIAKVSASASHISGQARHLLALGLANYAAGALLMPYDHFRMTARKVRHDIDQLCHYFGVSFEQACHRLSTLQRPGERGIPVFFCRVDMAGNITKRHSATRLQFARYGGACPLWVVHEAVAIPDRVLVQLSETPDGVRYVSMAKGLVKPSGTYMRSPRRYAVALGCEIDHAGAFIYADSLNIRNPASATPIGVSCRLCPRPDCDQRAFPPADQQIIFDRNVRNVVPYSFG